MEKVITIKNEYKSLDELLDFVKKESSVECNKVYDSWDVRTDEKGNMEQCLVLKKSSMNGMKVFITKNNSLKMTHIVPSKVLNAYFGKSQKSHKNILEVITGKISETLFSGSRKKAFNELEQVFKKIAA